MGFDFDHCIGADGKIAIPEIEDYVPRLGSYTEVSPSGTGLHVFVYAALPSGRRKKDLIECYNNKRYLTVTGRCYDGTPRTIEHRQEEVDAVHAAVFAERKREQTEKGQKQNTSESDAELLKLARAATNGAKFKKLYDQGDVGGYTSQSEADLAVCVMLAFWTRRDGARIDRLFRASKLMRDKWDREDYRQRTLDEALARCREVWSGVKKESPRPLFRETLQGEPFPTEHLGQFGAAAAIDVQRATRAHSAICGQSILAAGNLVVMGHANIELPHGEIKPISEYFVTIAASGERKTSADNRAAAGIVEHQNADAEEYREEFFDYKNALDVWEKARTEILAQKKIGGDDKRKQLRELGEAPEPPVTNIVLIGADPTLEGLVRFFREGGASIAGQFTSEGAGLVGGHSMSEDARLRTVAGFSLLWDGATLPRVRGAESHSQVSGRRLAMHILIQPRIAAKLYGDPDLYDQGFLTRVLTVMPDTSTTACTYLPPGEYKALEKFTEQTKKLLDEPFTYQNAARPREGLKPRVITLDDEAKTLWTDFHDEVAVAMVSGGRWFPIRGFAAKAAEHAGRLGVTIALFDDPDIKKMGAKPMKGGVALMKFFLAEQLRIREGLTIDEELKKARDLLDWLLNVWKEPEDIIALPDIYQLGPYAIQNKDAAEKVVKILEGHGHLERRDPCEVNGKFRRAVWKIVRSDE